MKRTLTILAVVLLLLGSGVAAYVLLQRPAAQQGTEPGTTFPGSENGGTAVGTPTVTITALSGDQFTAKDFVHDPDTIPDTANPGSYLLAGSLGYCAPGMRCTAASSTEFNIGYSETDDAFTVALLSEPLGKARHDAERFLMDRLGLSESQMCALNYYVGTTYWVNERYSSDNLGFSFCPGAIMLP